VHQLTIQVPQFPLFSVTNYYSTIHLFQATDGLFSEEVTITVTVSDVNDNPPVFGRDSYSVAVLENRPQGTSTLAWLPGLGTSGVSLAGTSVLTVKATDEDLGKNATISFSTAGGDERLFTVDCKSVLQLITHGLVLPCSRDWTCQNIG
jgi:hypothetical protein